MTNKDCVLRQQRQQKSTNNRSNACEIRTCDRIEQLIVRPTGDKNFLGRSREKNISIRNN